MKKLLCFLFVSSAFLLSNCVQDDLHKSVDQHRHSEDFLEGKTITVDQETLESIYAENENLNNIFKNQFEKDLSIKTISSLGSKISTRIDLDHIQVFESNRLQAITYAVHVFDEKGYPSKEIFNLMYYSTDKENYYVTLLKYDFSKISFQQFLKDPSFNDVISIYPLDDYQDIDKELHRSITSVNPIYTKEIIPLGDCVKEVSVAGNPCKGSGNPKHEYGDASCGMTGNNRATPGYTYMDFSDCGKGSGNPGGGGGGGYSPGPGSPGGPPYPGGGGGNTGGGGSNPPIKVVTPIKNISDLVKSGILLGQINIGSNNANVKMLKAISSHLKDDVKSLYSKLNEFKEYGTAHKFGIENGNYTYNPSTGKLTLPNPVGINSKIDASIASLAFYGVIHTHPISFGSSTQASTPLFSPADLSSIFKYTNKSAFDPNRKPSEAFVGVVNKYGMYVVMLPNSVTSDNIATKYSDFVKVKQSGNFTRVSSDKDKQVWIDMEKDLLKEYSTIENSNDSENIKKKNHEKALLKVLKKHKLEVNIYFIDSNEGNFNSTWQKLSLNNNQVQYTTIN